MRVFVRANRACKKLHTAHALASLRCHIRERSVIPKSFPHQLDAKQTVWKTARIAHGYLNSLHRLECGHIKFPSHECQPDSVCDRWMQGISLEHPRNRVIGEFGFAGETLGPTAEHSIAGSMPLTR